MTFIGPKYYDFAYTTFIKLTKKTTHCCKINTIVSLFAESKYYSNYLKLINFLCAVKAWCFVSHFFLKIVSMLVHLLISVLFISYDVPTISFKLYTVVMSRATLTFIHIKLCIQKHFPGFYYKVQYEKTFCIYFEANKATV